MADKMLLHNSLGVITNRSYLNGVCGGTPFSTNTRESLAEIRCTATFSRPRPSVLIPTPMQWRHRLTEGTLNWDTTSCFGAPLYPAGSQQGTLRHCAGAYVSGTSRSSLAQSNALVTKARAKQVTRFASIAETVFEARSTASMISKSIRRTAQIALYLRRGHWRSLSDQFSIDVPSSVTRLKPSRRLADGWLELEFGWKPLVQTAYDALEAYQRRVKRGQYVSASSGSPFVSHDLETHAKRVFEGKLSARATHCGYVANVGVVTLASMGFLSPAQIAWNLLPYSFVVDWFSNTGEALAALSSDFGLSNVRIVQTYETGLAQFPTRAYRDQCSAFDCTSYRAVSVDGVPIEGRWKPASITNWRIVTSMALLRQRFHGSY